MSRIPLSPLCAAVLSAGMLMARAPAAHAAVIEQSAGVFDAAISAFGPIGQSFVAEDSLLGQIAFAFSDINPTHPNDPITMTLYSGSGFSGSVLATVVQTLPSVLPGTLSPPVFIDFDFTGIALTIGNTYTAAVTTTSPKVAVVYNGADAYAGGLAFESSPSLNLSSCSAGCDLNFRVTPASVVPLPAAVWLFGSGLAGLAGFARRARTRAVG